MADGAPVDGPGARDGKRRAILDAARRHFMIEGYAATGMEAVARSAGVSTATLYGHFPGKIELFEQVIADVADEFTARIPPPAPRGADGAEQLRAFAIAYAGFLSDPFIRSVIRLVTAERRRFMPTAQRIFERGRAAFGGALMMILTRLSDDGVARFPKASWAAGQLMGMIEHPTIFVPLVTGEEVTAERSIEEICDEAVATFLARYGVRPGDGSRIEPLADPLSGKVLAPES